MTKANYHPEVVTHCVGRNSHLGRGVVLILINVKLERRLEVDSPLLEPFEYLA